MRPHSTLSPIQILLSGFLGLTVVGGLLLTLPLASQYGSWLPLVDGIFTAASAVSTTGLGVVSTGHYFSLFGQFIILALVQVGGLGYMTLIVFVMHLLGQKLSLQGGTLMQQSLAGMSRGEIRSFVRRVVLFTLLFEGVGAAALTLRWWLGGDFPFFHALYQAIFHSISTFCTAGFSLWDDSFIAYQDDLWVNLIINVLSYGGAIGFFVLNEAYLVLRKRWRGQPHRLSIHSKLALSVTLGLGIVGTLVVAWAEYTPGVPWGSHLLRASFQTISASSTTGFNSVAIGEMHPTSLIMLVLLMFIGSPTGGTGGGIKSTTFGVLLLILWATVKGDRDVTVFGRRIAMATLINSLGVGMTATLWLALLMLVLTATETFSLMALVFEGASALGTVGLSMGITADLTALGKWAITLTMLVGRIGPLSVAFALVRQRHAAAYRFPSEEVLVG